VVPDGRGRYLAFFEARVRVEDLDGALMEVRKRLIQVAGIGPSAVACLAHGTLPKTPSGKLRRTVIAALAGELVDTSLAHRDF
jgi:acyl-coenzyme A synthetase/AMP-(fatty) acid ligase